MSAIIVTTVRCTEPRCYLSTMESKFPTSLHYSGSAAPLRLHLLHSPKYLQDSWILTRNLQVHVSVYSSNSSVIFRDCHSCSHIKQLLCLDCLMDFFAQSKIFTGYLIREWQWFDYLFDNNKMMPVSLTFILGDLLNHWTVSFGTVAP